MRTLISGVVLSICVVHVVAQDALKGVLAHARAKRDAGEFRMAARHLEERFNTVVEPAAVGGWLEAEADDALFDPPSARSNAEKALRRLDGLPPDVRDAKPVIARRRALEAAEIWATARGGRRDALAPDLVARGLALVDDALAADPKLASAHLLAALFHREAASTDRLAWERMEESFRRATVDAPNDPVVRYFRAEQRVREGRIAAAVAEYDELLRRTRDFRPAVVRRLVVGARIDPKDALLKADTLLRKYPDERAIHNFRTWHLLQRSRQDDAGFTVLQYAQAAFAVAPYDLDTLENYVRALIVRGKHAEAVNAATDGVFGTNGALRERTLGDAALAPLAEGGIPGMDVYRASCAGLGVAPREFTAAELERARKPPPELLVSVRRAARTVDGADRARRFRPTRGAARAPGRSSPLRPTVVDEGAQHASRVVFANAARSPYRVRLLNARDERGDWSPVDVGWLELLPRQKWTVTDARRAVENEPLPFNASAVSFVLRLPDGALNLWAPCPAGAPLKIEVTEADLVYFAQLIRSEREYAARVAACAMALPGALDLLSNVYGILVGLGKAVQALRDDVVYSVVSSVAPDLSPEKRRQVAAFVSRVLDTGFTVAGVAVVGVASVLEAAVAEGVLPEELRPCAETVLRYYDDLNAVGLILKRLK